MMRWMGWSVIVLLAKPVMGQTLEARFGLLATTTLVRDEGASAAAQRALAVESAAPTELRLAPAPVASVLLVQAITTRTAADVSASFALARLRAHTQSQEWPVQNVSLVALTAGLRHHVGRGIWLNAGVGANRYFAESTGIFSEGAPTTPLYEAGALISHVFGGLPVHAAARVQGHRFRTKALEREGAREGNPTRFLLQLGLGR